MDIKKELTHTTFLQREDEFTHITYQHEMSVFQLIKDGNVEQAKDVLKIFLANGSGTLSKDEHRNAQYMFVAGVTLMTRFAIEGGMLEKDAYNISDLYIQKMDAQRHSISAIKQLQYEAALEFAKGVRAAKKKNVYSKPVLQAINYIYDHLHYPISVEEVANEIHLSVSYFSSLFKKEVGTSVANYIRNMRIEAAKNMLQFSDYSYQDISNYLAFSSQSHFISIFKKVVGITPKEYRTKHFSTLWKDS